MYSDLSSSNAQPHRSRSSRRLKCCGMALLPALLITACGGGGVSSVDDAKQAVIRIVATGSFQDPQVGLQLNAAGSGSGFIIDPSGIAVTNNHVVTGAATLEVFVGGSSTPVSAKILGVSECADLAVIDLDGEGYPYLEWYPEAAKVNTDVRSAGFPLGSPEYTLTRGIVSKASTVGETEWASVDAVIEHDARINPGNSGGPLLDDNARVVGVNYAGRADTGQNFSISAQLARRIAEELKQGKNVHSIGINGKAVFDEAAQLTGVWVSSVKTGSPASNAGIQGGDIIVRLEGLALATDGTMKTYCDVLQSRRSDEVLKVEVLRYATGEVLAGELNGKALTQSFSFANTLGDQVADQPGDGAPASYDSYVEVSDDSGLLTLKVPAAWDQVNGSSTEDGDPALSASHDLDGYNEFFDVAGVMFVVSKSFATQTDAQVLDSFTAEDCVSQGRNPYEDSLYRGTFEFFTGCGGSEAARAIVVARPPSNQYAAVVDMQIVTDADLKALDEIINSFVVNDGG